MNNLAVIAPSLEGTDRKVAQSTKWVIMLMLKIVNY